MMFSQYLRIEVKAGGVAATNRQFVKAAHSVVSKKGKTRACREARHQWLREGLSYLTDCRSMS